MAVAACGRLCSRAAHVLTCACCRLGVVAYLTTKASQMGAQDKLQGADLLVANPDLLQKQVRGGWHVLSLAACRILPQCTPLLKHA
jgi:hypothetical protein